MQLDPDIILVDKPVGMTSSDVLRILQKLYKMKKEGHARTLTFTLPKRVGNEPKSVDITSTPELDACFESYGAHNPSTKKLVCGHAGTLDPNASGLLIVGVGKGTKKLKSYVGLPKTYVAEIRIGERRTTSDMEGEVLESVDVPEISEKKLKEIVFSMTGVLRLPVSAFSAIKRGGRPLYKRAHQGKDVGVLPLRDMQVNSAEYISHECGEGKCAVTVRFNVESGVYIRSLAEELGKRLAHTPVDLKSSQRDDAQSASKQQVCGLGYPAVLEELRRTKIGEYHVDDARVIKI